MNNFFVSFKNDFWNIVMGSLIFMVSFLWKDLIYDIEDLYFPQSKGLFSRFIFVFLLTLLVIFIVALLRNLLKLRYDISFDDSPDLNLDAGSD